MKKLHSSLILPVLALGLLAACSGGTTSAPPAPVPTPIPAPRSLVYTNPSTGSFRLVQDVSKSSASHLVLNLVGPSGSDGRGVAFHLVLPGTQATWSHVDASDTEYAQSPAFPASALSLLKTKVTGTDLQVGAFQLGSALTPVPLDSAPLAKVALDLKAGAAAGAVTLTIGPGVVIPGTDADPMGPLTITVGTLVVQ